MDIYHQLQNLRADPYDPEHMRALIVFYWRTLLVCAGVLFVASLLYCGAQFMSVTESVDVTQSNSAGDSASKSLVDTTRLKAVLQGSSARKARFDARVADTPVIADPAR